MIQLRNRAIKYIFYNNSTKSSYEFMLKKRFWSFNTLINLIHSNLYIEDLIIYYHLISVLKRFKPPWQKLKFIK